MFKCPICGNEILIIYGHPDSVGVSHCYRECSQCKTPLDFQRSEWGVKISYPNRICYTTNPFCSARRENECFAGQGIKTCKYRTVKREG